MTRRTLRRTAAVIRGLTSLLVALAVLLGAGESALCRADGPGHDEQAALHGASGAAQEASASEAHTGHAATPIPFGGDHAPTGAHRHAFQHDNHCELCALPALVAALEPSVVVSRAQNAERLPVIDRVFEPFSAHAPHTRPRAPPSSLV